MTSKPNRACVCIQSVRISLSVSLRVCVCVCEETDIRNALADTMSLNDWVIFFSNHDIDSDLEGF